MSSLKAVIALTRFGMGPMPGEIETVLTDPRGWLLEQIHSPYKALLTSEGLLSSQEVTRFVIDGEQHIEEARKAYELGETEAVTVSDIRRKIRLSFKKLFEAEIHSRNEHAITTPSGFSERWVRFWSNHFSVSTRHPNLLPIVNSFEREAIRPNVFGKFSDLLDAATFHPAMLYYLENNGSVGPTSKAVDWARSVGRPLPGLNENLAREILELHTLGVGGGYQQADILAFAKMLTGWTILGLPSFLQEGPANIGEVIFYSKKHEHSDEVFLEQFFSSTGPDQAKEALASLAIHPSTARYISTKLLRHFVGVEVNPADVKSLEMTFLETGGDLKEVAQTLIYLDSVWNPEFKKLKTPEELIISTGRALGMNFNSPEKPTQHYKLLGQIPFSAPSPEGWPDVSKDWAGSDSIKKRIEWAYELVASLSNTVKAKIFLETSLGPHISQRTLYAVENAESNRAAMALAIMSPEFQRR